MRVPGGVGAGSGRSKALATFVAMPFASSSHMPFVASSDALATSRVLLLVVRPGATSSVLAPSSDALCY